MHLGFPSDCPHRERLGYTGDGGVCSLAAMTLIDSKDFYRKWIRDIFDSQDKIGGHVAHTAPFAGGGGGPVGWGGAAITVPYNYYKTFGDKTPLYEHYEGMKRYVDYILSRSLGGLVMREEDGGWVLGDWCTLDECVIPAPLVNTALFVKCLEYMSEISLALEQRDDAERFDVIRAEISHALRQKYIDTATGDFADGVQGANAYAIYASVADERTKRRLIEKYCALGHFDTGFIGTYVLAGLLFDIGAKNVAFELMTSHEPGGFGYMMDRGATTLWEYWRGEGSHDHPMFGASALYLFSHILGITQLDGSYGYERVLIRPIIPDLLDNASGSIMTPKGEIGVAFERTDSGVNFTVTLPDGISADFEYESRKERLTKCLNHVSVQEYD
jgi:alpha-L-rhamnosidase